MSIQLPNPEEDYVWDLHVRDGRVIPFAPNSVEAVKDKLQNGESVGSIPADDVVRFERTDRRFTDYTLQEETARLLKEPLMSHDNRVKARWVKKEVSQSEYDKYYGKSMAYRYLDNSADGVMIAMTVPAHMVDLERVQYCTPDEEEKLGLGE